jgi:hypothetical protein
MKLYIPEIGDSIKLIEPWTFSLYNESRNESLMEFVGDFRGRMNRYDNSCPETIPCIIPAGEILKVDRIYIRKGIKDYSSITFLWKGKSTEPRIETYGPGYGLSGKQYKIPRKPVRFWAKLSDVNNIEFEMV